MFNEDITLKRNKLKFNYKPNEKAKFVNTSLGKQNFNPRITTLKNSKIKVLTPYSKIRGKQTTDIIKTIKQGVESGRIKQIDYDNFISRTALFFYKVLKNKNIDTILLIQSSSDLSYDLAKKLQMLFPDSNIKLFSNAIQKNIENIKINLDIQKLSHNEKELLKKLYNKIKYTNEFNIKKIHPKHRSLFYDWLSINQEIIKYIVNKNILIVDDYLTSGTTLDEACSAIIRLSPKSIIAATLIK